MKLVPLTVILSLPILGACGPTGFASSATASRVAPASGGTVNLSLSSESNRSVSRAGVGTVAYVSGTDVDRGQIVAAAGISGTPNVGAARTSGSGTYTTRYQYVVVDNITRTDTLISGTRGEEAGTMSLAADFDAGTLTGSTSELTVNGTISGSDVGGNVTANYSGSVLGGGTISGSVNGELAGDIGTNGVIATFHGSDNNTVMAGGLVGSAD
ncbi:hypothetical protein Q4544_12615 [Cognatishimia sp. 1_MG-2023]|uniref:hypothetical protein n=1 Tax=Cognatishimia sp. 1_MG-2023 TaxID=3062642 RepID=UPI0026E43EAF|nr:hypothetical protein [Cognatishimia sp. 1_MG-2023]MDO6727775.1 hypothetical protein [Cognatishimia sp. 1_MG-2023]